MIALKTTRELESKFNKKKYFSKRNRLQNLHELKKEYKRVALSFNNPQRERMLKRRILQIRNLIEKKRTEYLYNTKIIDYVEVQA